MIASDVDGTLIDDRNQITQPTVDVLVRAADAGVELVLSTGRPPRWIPEIAEQLAATPAAVRYAVCANGAIVYDVREDAVLFAAELGPDVLESLRTVCTELVPGCGLAAERAGTVEHDAATPSFVSSAGYEHAWLNPDHVEVADHHLTELPAVKLLARKPGMSSHEMAALITPHIGDLAEVTFSIDTGLIELSVPGVHKASGLQWLLANTDVAGSSVIAFGDMPNDAEMLRWAAHGVAMGNGDPVALAAADEIAGTNADDGVARVLERWF
ncbi:HAD family hydrolase [Gordonia liuliyuniae]|uniref:Cof-type HAD-IIB family hydrolase n=1 Tax=Gordonia liuliyuniae TaxID=2911517 RepID=A0ABS9IP14_9ACTN|nr:HAD family hydrolase [Gordonia liuliyuniae]MCF8587286.1 Cof-type HAD-IIB family hydrolase [Gordonia liuliyuniae]